MLEFWIPLTLLLITAGIPTITARRKRDRCLRFFKNRPIIIRLTGAKWIWGNLIPYANTLELVYNQPDEDGKSSYVLYKPEIENIDLILQPPAEKRYKST